MSLTGPTLKSRTRLPDVITDSEPMRMMFGLFWLTLICAFAMQAMAQQRWCFITNEGGTNCSFLSMEQCQQSSAGTGGFCMLEAPAGHRQPRPSAEPARSKNESDKRLDELNRRLDRQLKICKGC